MTINNIFMFLVFLGFSYTGLRMVVDVVKDLYKGGVWVYKQFTKKTFTLSKAELERALFLFESDRTEAWKYVAASAGLTGTRAEMSLNRGSGVLSYWIKKQ